MAEIFRINECIADARDRITAQSDAQPFVAF